MGECHSRERHLASMVRHWGEAHGRSGMTEVWKEGGASVSSSPTGGDQLYQLHLQEHRHHRLSRHSHRQHRQKTVSDTCLPGASESQEVPSSPAAGRVGTLIPRDLAESGVTMVMTTTSSSSSSSSMSSSSMSSSLSSSCGGLGEGEEKKKDPRRVSFGQRNDLVVFEKGSSPRECSEMERQEVDMKPPSPLLEELPAEERQAKMLRHRLRLERRKLRRAMRAERHRLRLLKQWREEHMQALSQQGNAQ